VNLGCDHLTRVLLRSIIPVAHHGSSGRTKKIRHGAQDLAGGAIYGDLIKCYER